MRRKDKEITDRSQIESIIRRSSVCRLAMADGDRPYVVPLCFGYQDHAVYFHSAREGKKLDILKKNPRVCVEFDIDQEIKKGESPCRWSMRYQSVVGFGRASILEDLESMRRALNIILRQYSDLSFDLADGELENTVVIRVEIESMTGKRSGI